MDNAHKLALTAAIALAFIYSCSSNSNDNHSTPPPSSSNNSSSYSSSESTSSHSFSDKGNSISSYKTVAIGAQTWMAENLNYKVDGSKCYGEGGKIIISINPIEYEDLTEAEIQASCDKYGRLYDWAAAMALPSNCNNSECAEQVSAKHRGICPSGWHIPSNEEWATLAINAGGTGTYGNEGTAGTKLKATEGWNSHDGIPAGTDEHGFAALPGGVGDSDGDFSGAGYGGYWRSSSELDAHDAFGRHMLHNYESVLIGTYNKSRFYSVRCVKD